MLKILWKLSKLKGICWYFRNSCVVTNHAGQWMFFEFLLLSFCENIIIFPPKSGKNNINFFWKYKIQRAGYSYLHSTLYKRPTIRITVKIGEFNNNKSKHHDHTEPVIKRLVWVWYAGQLESCVKANRIAFHWLNWSTKKVTILRQKLDTDLIGLDPYSYAH